MAFSASGLFLENFIDAWDATQLAIDTSLTTHKWALYNNTDSPDYGVDTAYSSTNEVSGTGYTAGGQVIASPTTTEDPTGTIKYDMADEAWTTATISSIRGGKLYGDALAGNNLFVGQAYGADYSVTAGTLTVQFASAGVFTDDMTP